MEIVLIVTLRVSTSSLLTGALMYPTGSHTIGILTTESRGSKFVLFCYFFCLYPILPQMTENEKKSLSIKLKPSSTTTRTSQNQEIFKTQIHV